MKLRTLLLCALLFAAVPGSADNILYSNGPTNGNTDAWGINYLGSVSDTFIVPSGGNAISGANFAMWLFPGDILQSAEVLITSDKLGGGTVYFDQVLFFSQSGCSGNQYGYNVCQETTNFSGPNLSQGTYWLDLKNARVNTGDPIYWDENSGPSSAAQCCQPREGLSTAVGTIPSESFTVLAEFTTFGASQTVPEPASLVTLLSGSLTVFGALGALRRKRF